MSKGERGKGRVKTGFEVMPIAVMHYAAGKGKSGGVYMVDDRIRGGEVAPGP